MRVLLSALLLGVAPVAMAQDQSAWEFVAPEFESASTENLNEMLAIPDEAAFEWTLNISDDLMSLRPGVELQVPMPFGALHQGSVSANRSTASGGRHLQIEFENRGDGALIHVGLNGTFGRIWTADSQYVIQPGPGGTSIMRIAPNDAIEHEPLNGSQFMPPISRASAETVDRPQAGTDTLDFLYFYDFEMIDVYGWTLPDLAATDIGNLQTALTESGVPLFAELTQLSFMDVPQNYSSRDLLVNDAGPRAGYFTGLQTRIDALGIDVVSLNRPTTAANSGRDGFCGLGFVSNPLSNFQGRSHINVCHNGLTLAHETGHNMGLAHGLETDGTSGRPVAWARGFRIDSQSSDGGIFTSVMAYGSNRTPQFSDPTIECPERGSVCGIPLQDNNVTAGSFATEALRRYATGIPSQGVPNARLRSAVLPTSRFVPTGSAATAFMTVINPNQVEGQNCIIEHHGPYRDTLTFQPTNPATNEVIGTQNLAVNIPARGSQTFVISLTPGADVSGVRFAPYASCDNIPMAAVARGLNTVDLGADAAGGPDLVALSATAGNTGIVEVPDGRRGAFAVATSNLGGAGEVTVSAQSLDPMGVPATGQVCQTNSGGGCLSAPQDQLTLNIGAGETPTFAVFVSTDYAAPFNPRSRFQFQMTVNGEIRGSTSVAIRDGAPLVPPSVSAGNFSVRAGNESSGQVSTLTTGFYDRFEIVNSPGLGSVEMNGETGAYTYTAGNTDGGDSFTYRAGNASGWSAPATITVTVDPVPLPVVTAFTVEDDTEGEFSIDLDNHADESIEIDRFVLTTPPSGTYSFNELTGVISGTLPSNAGDYGFTFAAENLSGQSAPVAATFNVVAYDACAPRNSTESRITRRLESMSGFTADGTATLAEISQIATNLCMEAYDLNQTSFRRMRNTSRGIDFAIQLISSNTRYRVYLNNDGGPSGWDYIFDMCKTGGRLTAC